MRSVFFAFLLLAGCTGSESDTDSDLPADWNDSRIAASDGDSYTLTYTPSPDPIPLSDEFALTVMVVDGSSAPITGATLSLDASMPAHGHGMNTTPVITDNEDGSWTINGMLFHMPMHWRIAAEVSKDGSTEAAHWDVMCCD